MNAPVHPWHARAWQLSRAACDRGAHALLLHGARGIGKRELALALAASRLCHAPRAEGFACGGCESCRWLAAGTHPDFALVEPLEEADDEREAGSAAKRARFITIEQVRALTAMLGITAHRAAGRAIVIHPAEAMNAAAANALLKSLEEPPPAALFLLVSHRPALLPPTVRSRCHGVPLHVEDMESARAWLAQQTDAEDAALLLALAGGAPVQALAIASDPQWSRRSGLLQMLAAADADPIRIAELYRDVPPPLLLAWLQTWTYDLLRVRHGGEPRFHRDLAALAESVARRIDPVRIARLHRSYVAWQREIHHPLNARLLAEQLLIACVEMTSTGVSA